MLRVTLYLLLGVAVVVVGITAARYLLTPAYFRPGIGPFVVAVALLAGLGASALRRRRAP